MWQFRHKVGTLISGVLSRRWSGRRTSAGPVTDWLPPVLGPYEWTIGIMADRSANWYFERR